MTLQFPGNTYFLEINKHQGLIANTENSFLIRRKLHRLLRDTRNARHRHRAVNNKLQTEDEPPDGMMGGFAVRSITHRDPFYSQARVLLHLITVVCVHVAPAVSAVTCLSHVRPLSYRFER